MIPAAAEKWFLQRGECPDCRAVLDTKEFGVENELDEVTAVTIEYCNECDESKEITVARYARDKRL